MFSLPKTFACLAVGVVALAAVEGGQLHDQVLEELERALDEQFVGDFEAARLTGTLLWGFTAHDVQIRDARGEPVAHIDALEVEASAFELLDGELRFDSARFVRPSVLVESYADGTTNFDEVFSSRDDQSDQSDENDKRVQSDQRDKKRAPGEVRFEMTRAEIVDGQLLYVDPVDATGAAARTLLGDDRSIDETTSVLSTRDIDAKGTFRVLSGDRTETILEQLDADIVPSKATRADQKPHHLSLRNARVDTDAGRSSVSATRLTVDDHWQIDDFRLSRAGKFAADAAPLAFRARASSPGGGSLSVDGLLDPRDDSYDLALRADDFAASGWPGAPDWSWLVLDGVGAFIGRGWSREEMDATARWTANDFDVAGEHVDRLRLVARVANERVDVDTLQIAASDFSTSASGHVTAGGAFSLTVDTLVDGAFAKRVATRIGETSFGRDKLGADIVGDELRDVAHLQLSTKARGRLDFDGRGLMDVVERADVDTTWKAKDVILDDLRWGVAGGSLDIDLPRAPRNERYARRFGFQVTAALHDLHYGALEAKVLRASVKGDGSFGTEDTHAWFNYVLDSDADDLQLGEHRAKQAQLEARGALTSAGAHAQWPLETLSARGTLDLTHYRSNDMRAGRVAANIDVRGPFPIGEGTIDAHMTGLRADGRRFRHAAMKLRLLEDQKFRFESKARVEISLIPDLPLYLKIAGRHGQNFDALSLDKLSFGRPGMRWKTREPGLVLFREGAVVLQSLTLRRLSQRVRLDGAYGHGKKGSISDICSRLKNAQLRSFFDLSGIKRSLRNIF